MDAANIDPASISFNLEDAYEDLKAVEKELKQEIDDLVHDKANNDIHTLSHHYGQHSITNRHHKFIHSLAKVLYLQEPEDLPIAGTIDLHKCMINDFLETIDHMQKMLITIKEETEQGKKQIAHLNSNKAGLQKMKDACRGAVENVHNYETYREEIDITKELFQSVKDDLYTVVDTIFPDNDPFKELLASFTEAYRKGGDDVYIDVVPENLIFVKFLVEADIAVYHRNDKSKIRMTDLL